MDALTHGITGWLLSRMMGMEALAPFFILGSMIPDIDLLFHGISNRDPRLYIFSHGGYTHSILGSISLASIAFLGISVLQAAPVFSAHIPCVGIPAFLGLFAGVLLHISLDILAFPGIPILYPATDRKFTIGVFPGPSMVIMVFSLFYAAYSWVRSDWNGLLGYYLLVMAIFVLLSSALKASVALVGEGLFIPTFNPFRWLNVVDRDDSYLVRVFSLLEGEGDAWLYEKAKGVSREELMTMMSRPEIARHRYFSYISIAERVGNRVVFSDPIRENGLIFYPPRYRRLILECPNGDTAPLEEGEPFLA